MVTQQPDTQLPCPSSATGNGKEAQAESSVGWCPGLFDKANEPKSVRETWHMRASIPPLLAQKVLGRPAEVGGG